MAPDILDVQRLRVIGLILRKARENLRFSYREVSEIAGVSASQVLRMESGEFEFSASKLARVCEALGLSIGIVMEAAMYRRVPRPELLRFNTEYLEGFLRGLIDRGGHGKVSFEDAVSMMTDLVRGVAEVVASLILSSNPESLCFYFVHPFKVLQERIETFGHTRLVLGTSHFERASSLKALFADPVAKLQAWQILDVPVLMEFFEWIKKNTYPVPIIKNAFASTLFAGGRGQIDGDWLTETEPAKQQVSPKKVKKSKG